MVSKINKIRAFIISSIISLLSLFWKENESRLMRSLCCHQFLNAWANLYEIWYVYHGTWAHLNCILHKSLTSVCTSVCVYPIVEKTLQRQRIHTQQYENCWTSRIKERRRVILLKTSCRIVLWQSQLYCYNFRTKWVDTKCKATVKFFLCITPWRCISACR
jgi:hypothetical protein